jgi:hypothetical protein
MIRRYANILLLSSLVLKSYAMIPGLPTGNSTPTTQNSSDFAALLQQNTNQALQIFQNVTYKKLSEGQDQNYFFNNDANSNGANLLKQELTSPEN